MYISPVFPILFTMTHLFWDKLSVRDRWSRLFILDDLLDLDDKTVFFKNLNRLGRI